MELMASVKRALKNTSSFPILILLGFSIVIVLTLFSPIVDDMTEGSTTVSFRVGSSVWWDACVPVRWDIEGIHAVYLNGEGHIGHWEEMSCRSHGDSPELTVTLRDGSQRTFGPAAVWATRCKAILQVIAAVLLLGSVRANRTTTGNSQDIGFIAGSKGLVAALVFGVIAVLIPRNVLEQIAPQFASIVKVSESIFQISGGFVQLFIFACLIAALYWFVVPRRVRNLLLCFCSILALLLLGASLEFALLAGVMVIATHVASFSPVQVENHADKGDSTLVQIVAVIYLMLVEAIALISALWFNVWTVIANPIVVGGLFLFTVLLILGVARKGRITTRRASPANSAPGVRPAPVPIAGQVIFGAWFLGIAMYYLPTVWRAVSTQLTSILALLYFGVFVLIGAWILENGHRVKYRRILAYATICSILLAFVFDKWPLLHNGAAFLGWIGFSYFAFRLLHVLLDSLNKRYCEASPLEMLVYALFYPVLLIGPIDRLPRFLKDLRESDQPFAWKFIIAGLTRIAIGAIKKFFIADILLAPLALGISLPLPYNFTSAWTQVIAYSFYILFDFSGYIDIALGIGYLVGFTLPENFDSPYAKPNITRFWQAWHITLSDWLRTYVFFRLSGRLMRTTLRTHPNMVVFLSQMITMLLIGLWHGITMNFALSGIWHGVGLFVHKIYTDHSRKYTYRIASYPRLQSFYTFWGMALTFVFVSLGWVFFCAARFSRI
jgi:alginate O-acetyltransferase complex protein AlgI